MQKLIPLFGIVVAAGMLTGCATHERQHLILPERGVEAPFSEAVIVGNTLYVAGQLGVDPETGAPPDDPSEEARLLLENFREVVQAAGMSMEDLVSVQVYADDVALYDVWNGAYREYVPEPFPARAFIGSGPLLFGARFEMKGIAVRR